MSDFVIKPFENDIYLYGAASIGKIIFQNFTKLGIKIKGFIDKRAGEIKTFLGLPVIKSVDDTNSIILLSVKNVFEHYLIADDFIERGFTKLIYMPREVLDGTGTEEQLKIAHAYNTALDGTFDTSEAIPSSYTKYNFKFTEYPIICDYKNNEAHRDNEEGDGGKVLVNLPLSFIYTNNYDPKLQKWGNVNVLAFFTHLNFFECLLGSQDANVSDYLNEYCVYTAKMQGDILISDAWKENVLNNRTMIFQQMNKAFDLDSDFFIRNPATAQWNKSRKYFNLTSGKHRVMFQVAKGKRFIPVKITKEDYALFLNSEAVSNLVHNERVHINTSESISTDNPFFYNYPINDFDFIYILKKYLSKFFAKEIYAVLNRVNFSYCKFYFDGTSYTPLARHFAKMGASVTCSNLDEKDNLIAEIEQVKFDSESQEHIFNIYVGNTWPISAEYDYICSTYHNKMVDMYQNLKNIHTLYKNSDFNMGVYRKNAAYKDATYNS